jgi:pimeloyl-ACP methyl ester carboxylesterase
MTNRKPRRGYADTPLGQLHYVEQGDGEPILLLHQTPRSSDEFAELLPLLAQDRRAIAMDMPGFGSSPAVPAPQSIEGMAAGALALLDALDLPAAALLGHHTGAAVAVEVAASAPRRVTALVLSSPPWIDEDYRRRHRTGTVVDDVDRDEAGGHLAGLWQFRRPYYPDGRPDLLDRFVRDALAPGVDPAEGHRACARYRMEERIGMVSAPTLVLQATADPFASPAAPVVRAHLTAAPTTEIAVLEGGTIPLMEHMPEQVAAAVHPFLTTWSGG